MQAHHASRAACPNSRGKKNLARVCAAGRAASLSMEAERAGQSDWLTQTHSRWTIAEGSAARSLCLVVG